MHLLYTDETNLEERAGDFLLYGGLVVPPESALPLTREVDGIREAYGVPPGFLLKFNPGPSHLDHEEFKSLKNDLMDAAFDHECTLLVYMVLHDVAQDPDEARRFGINTLAFHFDCLLARERSLGLVLIDRFTDRQIDDQLRERFQVGVRGLPYSEELRLKNIVGFHYTAIGQAHFCTLIDVLLGSLRFAVNAVTRADEGRLESANTLLRLVGRLFRCRRDGKVSNLSVHFSPREVRHEGYREIYRRVHDFLAQGGFEPEQRV